MMSRSRFGYLVWRIASRLVSWHPHYALLRGMGDVLEALGKPEVFSVAVYDARMRAVLGPFLLGRQPGPEYDEEIRELAAAMPASDIPDIEKWARQRAEQLIGDAINSGSPIDVVEGLANPLLLDFVQYYYGVPTEPEFLKQIRSCSSYIFGLDLLNGPRGHVEAVAAGRAISDRIDRAIEERKLEIADGGASRKDVMTRLIEGSLSTDRIRDTIGGTVTGTLIPTIGTFLHTLEVLLDLPRAKLESIRHAARQGNYQRIRRVAQEAARLKPFPAALFRYTTDDTCLASGKRVKAHKAVMLDTTSANRDRRAVDRPGDFEEDRPAGQRLLFGHDRHRCIGAIDGREIAQTLLQELATPLLALPNLRRVRGRPGRLGPLTLSDHLLLEFDPQ